VHTAFLFLAYAKGPFFPALTVIFPTATLVRNSGTYSIPFSGPYRIPFSGPYRIPFSCAYSIPFSGVSKRSPTPRCNLFTILRV